MIASYFSLRILFTVENIQAYTNIVRIYYKPLSSTNLHRSASESSAVVSVALPFNFNLCFFNDFVACFLFANSEHLVVDRAFCVIVGYCEHCLISCIIYLYLLHKYICVHACVYGVCVCVKRPQFFWRWNYRLLRATCSGFWEANSDLL